MRHPGPRSGRDVSDPALAHESVQVAIERFGTLTGLVNNAHASRQKPLPELEAGDWELSFTTGFWATVQFMKAAYPVRRGAGR